MTKVKGPLFSVAATGTLADTLTFQKCLNQDSVKGNSFRKYSRSYLQDRDRRWLSWSVGHWHDIHPVTADAWRQYTDFRGLKGYHSFIRNFLRNTHMTFPQFEAPPYYGFCIVGNHYVGEFLAGGEFLTPP